DLEPARVAAERAPRRDHAVAGDDDRHRVVAERLSDGAASARLPDAACDLAVGHHLARGDPGGGEQHPALEGADVAEVDLDLESPPLAGEVGPELMDDASRPGRRGQDVEGVPL